MFFGIIHSIGTVLDLAGIAALLGVSWLLMAAGFRSEEVPAGADWFVARSRRMVYFCLSVLVVTSADNLLQRTMEMSGLSTAASLLILPKVIFKTHYGSMWLLRVAGLAAAWIIAIAARKRMGASGFGVLLFAAGAVIAFSRSASGHPADAGDLGSQQLADWAHLLSVGVVGGGIIAVWGMFSGQDGDEDGSRRVFAARTADRYYRVIGPVLAVLVFSGLYNAWFQVGSFAAMTTTAYGGLLLAKILVVVILATRFIVVPDNRDVSAYSERFLLRARADAVIVLAILVLVGMIVHRIPAKHQEHLKALALEKEGEQPYAGDRHEHEPVVTLLTGPEPVTAGVPSDMTVSIRDDRGMPLKGIEIVHERILHAVIIGHDLGVFAHIHPEDLTPVGADMVARAVFPLRYTFPRPGRYLVALDFAAGDESFSKSLYVDVSAPHALGKPARDYSLKKNVQGFDVTLKPFSDKLLAGVETTVRYHLERNGKPVEDLQPYLGAAMHISVVSEDLQSFIHTHGTVPGEEHSHHDHLHAPPPPLRFGPDIDADVVFPKKGTYKLFGQVAHNGKVLQTEFMVNVE